MWKCIAYRRKNFWRCLIFDEIYLQKSKKYFRGEIIGYDDEGELYKGNGIVCFMIVGLKESISYMIKSLSETNTDTNWLKTELLEFLSMKFFHWNSIETVVSVLERLFVTIIHRMGLVSRNYWNMSTRIQMNYICHTCPEKFTFVAMLSIQ